MLDLIVANYGSNTVSVLLGNGDGTFSAQQTFATGNEPRSVVVADVNGDTHPDVITTNGGGSVSVLAGNGNGTFAAQQTFATGPFPDSRPWPDVNEDTHPDLIMINVLSNVVDVLLGNGDGSFAAAAHAPPPDRGCGLPRSPT